MQFILALLNIPNSNSMLKFDSKINRLIFSYFKNILCLFQISIDESKRKKLQHILLKEKGVRPETPARQERPLIKNTSGDEKGQLERSVLFSTDA